MDNKEEMQKLDDSEMEREDPGSKLEEEEDMDGARIGSLDKLNWADKGTGCAMLAKVMPVLEIWEIGLLWQVLEDARKDPEGMDIKKLHKSAMSIAKDVTKNYLTAAGGEDETRFSLVMKKMMEMVIKARKKSISTMAGTLRDAQGKNRFLEQTHEGLKERIAGY